jgi:Zn-dependent M28 family amino/carboxypeptidase
MRNKNVWNAVFVNSVLMTVVFAVAMGLWGNQHRVLAADSADVAGLMAEGEKAPTLRANLRELTDEIGGRVPGTLAMERAVQWGVAKFKAAGADSVQVEKFSIEHGWAEGTTQATAHITGGGEFSLRVVSLGWGPAAALHGVPVVDLGSGSVEDFARLKSADGIKGKAVLVHTSTMKTWEDLFAEYMRTPVAIQEAIKGGAVAVLLQSTRPQDLLYRHTNADHGELEKIPAALLAREDADRIARLLAERRQVSVDLSMPNKISGPIQAANVIAEIRGSEKPDEYVVLGAHLDSWELGTGALDNGCNAALVVEALRAIKASGRKPRRSIRFILFSGEEEGLMGSRAYVHQHRADMDRYVAAVIFDSGTGRVTGFSLGGRKDVVKAVEEIVSPLKAWDAVALTTDADSGTDHMDFLLEGVPTLVANQEEANYLINYHASSDTFDKVDFANLQRHVAEAAVVAFRLADAPERVGLRISRKEIEQTLRETGLDTQMKGFGQWEDWESGARGREK